ncbi:radical SAM/SPASM domain Clo7bot peptide maturase [Marinitoga arctica]
MKTSMYNLFIRKTDSNEYLLFNTLTGHVFLIDENIKTLLETQKIQQIPENILYEFKKKKVIIDDEVNELNYIEYFHNKMKFENELLSLTILLTWSCNLNCVYCYEGAGNVRNSTMTSSTALKVIKFIKKEALKRRVKKISINLFGGEPLINYKIGEKILKEIKQFADENKIFMYTGIITNGTLINDEIINSLKLYNCKTVQITLDGSQTIHNKRRMYKNGNGTFEIIINNIKILNQKKDFPNPVIRINVDKKNIKNVYELLEFLKNEKLTDCKVDFGIVRAGSEFNFEYSNNCFIQEEEISNILNKLREHAKKIGFIINVRPIRKWMFCGLNSDYNFTISPLGDIYKCWEHVGDSKHKLGKLNDNGEIENIQYTFFDWMARNPTKILECRECIYLPVCGGGCGAISYEKHNSYHKSGCFKIKGNIENEVLMYLKSKKLI